MLENFTGVLTIFWVVKNFLGMLKILRNGNGVCSKQESFGADKNVSLVVKNFFLQLTVFEVAEELFRKLKNSSASLKKFMQC